MTIMQTMSNTAQIDQSDIQKLVMRRAIFRELTSKNQMDTRMIRSLGIEIKREPDQSGAVIISRLFFLAILIHHAELLTQ